MKTRTPFDHLALVPAIVADCVLDEVYTGREWSVQVRSQSQADKTEAARKLLTDDQRKEFPVLAEKWCRAAYDVKAEWFEKIVNPKSKTQAAAEKGRAMLYNVIRHWLCSYCNDPEHFRYIVGQIKPWGGKLSPAVMEE